MARKRKAIPATLEEALLFKPSIVCDEYVAQQAVRRHTGLCLMTRAIALSLPGATQIKADWSKVSYRLGAFRYVHQTPAAIAPTIAAWDDGAKFKPWTTRLQVPIGVRPVQNRPGPRRGIKYKRTGKYADPKRRCGRWTSRRWHGLVQPKDQ